MSEPIVVVPYDPEWPGLFARLGVDLRGALGDVALRIDHIGSTSVPGLDAKPIVDVQVSVASFEPLDAFRWPLEGLGFVFRADNPDLNKRYFREPPGTRRTHIHVRRAGSWSEQIALLFRDYMRAHDEDARRYAKLKYRLAEQYRDERHKYREQIALYLGNHSQGKPLEPGHRVAAGDIRRLAASTDLPCDKKKRLRAVFGSETSADARNSTVR